MRSPLDSSRFTHDDTPGPGRHITIDANPGHVCMVFDGRCFDTSTRHGTGSRWTSTQGSASRLVVRYAPGL